MQWVRVAVNWFRKREKGWAIVPGVESLAILRRCAPENDSKGRGCSGMAVESWRSAMRSPVPGEAACGAVYDAEL